MSTTVNYINFDRHAIFNESDRRMVLSAIDEAVKEACDMSNDEETIKELRALQNSLYGLFDGFLYNDLLVNVKRLLGWKEERDINFLVGRILRETKKN